MNTAVYQKGSAFFASVKASTTQHQAVNHQLALLRTVLEGMPPSPLTDEARAVLASVDAQTYSLPEQAVAELAALSGDRALRYLVHRHRFDIYPTKRILTELPPLVEIEPTSFCNYRCTFCHQAERSFHSRASGRIGHMTLDTFRRVLDELEGRVEFLTMAGRGEPLLCPDIAGMLETIGDRFLSVKMNTNGSMLDERLSHAILSCPSISTLVLSADAAEKALYAKLRVNGDLDEVVANLRNFQAIRRRDYPQSRLVTRVSGVYVGEEQSIENMRDLWGEIADQVAFVTHNQRREVYANPESGLTTPCSDLWRRVLVWWDGSINPCDVDARSVLNAGSIHQYSLAEIWQNEHYQNLRRIHLCGERTTKEPCRRCYQV